MSTTIPFSEIAGLSDSRDCKFSDDNCLIRPNGSLTIDLSSLKNINECIISCKRVSGNGLIICNDLELKVISKINQDLTVDIKDSKLKIKRPKGAIGNIIITNLIFQFKNEITSEDFKEYFKQDVATWAKVLKLCSPYKKISFANDKVYAAEGGELFNVNNIVTEPSNAYVKKDSFVKFVYPCEIISLEPYGNKNSKEQYLPHINSSSVNKNKKQHFSNQYYETIINNSEFLNSPSDIIENNNVIYDSESGDSLKVFKLSNITGSLSNSNRDLIMPNKSSFYIPLSKAEPNHKYIVIISAKKLNGNGKIAASIETDKVISSANTLITAFNKINLTYELNSSAGGSHLLKISRPQGAVGDVLISKILVYKGLQYNPNQTIKALRAVDVSKYTENNKYKFKISDEFEIMNVDPSAVTGEYEMVKNEDIKFVIVIPSYKNEKWTEKNLISVFSQEQKNYRTIFVDDCSPDKTFDIAQKVTADHKQEDNITLIRNPSRKGALENLYNSIHSCDDNEIIITLDGDDWLSNNKVITKLTEVYSDPNVWMTYGQYQSYPDNGKGCSQQIPDHIIKHNLFRQFRWCSSHLRTFYTWLFKKIEKEDFLDRSGKFYPSAWDLSIMLPQLEMAGFHAKFIPDILYIYNVDNPINDFKVDLNLQQSLEREIRHKKKYDRI